jgi:general L-amino acid transport system ATP-binding protein
MNARMTPSPTDSIVRFEALNKWFGRDFHVLRDISLDIHRGERLVVCGPSGSGKSTLIRCINALEPFQEGRLTVGGVALGVEGREDERAVQQVRRSVGMVFQQFNLFPHLSVLDNLTLAPINVGKLARRQAQADALAQLERVHIAEQAHKFPLQLSGGQQQRVAIARALCLQPQILLFDEPTSALDPEMVHEVLGVMTELAGQGITMVCVTHEMEFARSVADRVVFMDHGQIMEEAPPDAFFSRPQSERAQQFLDKLLGRVPPV